VNKGIVFKVHYIEEHKRPVEVRVLKKELDIFPSSILISAKYNKCENCSVTQERRQNIPTSITVSF
jgi:hypothetical protein